MCRLLTARIEAQAPMGEVKLLLQAFLRAAARDPRLEALTGGEAWSHCHGGGYTLYTGTLVMHERFDEGLCEANLERLQNLIEGLQRILESRGDEERLLILHVRRASRGMPRGPSEAHPYHAAYTTPKGIGHLYLAHNGSIHHEEIAAHLKVDAKTVTDSHILTLYLAHQIARGAGVEETLQEIKRKWLKTALILGILHLDPQARPMLYATAILSEKLVSKRRNYYEATIIEAPGLHAMANTTVTDYYRMLGGKAKLSPAEEIIILK